MNITIIDTKARTIDSLNSYSFFILNEQLYMKVEYPFVINIQDAKKIEMNPKTLIQPCYVENIIVKKC